MFLDLREFDDGAMIDADLAVIGAGAAGITIARELAGSARDVLLVESGGLEFDPDTQALYEGDSVGVPYFPLDIARLRYFGGTTNHWDGHCRPLDPIDFERRDWVPHSGWPIRKQDLDPYYERAQEICELGPYRYEAEQWPELARWTIPFAPTKLHSRLWQFGPPTRFGPVYRDVLASAANVQVLTYANVADIRVNESGRAVTHAVLKALDGRTATLRPKTLILACGGIENARLLLAANGQQPAGLGNGYGLVGRFFMEHPHALVAYAVRQVDLQRFELYYGSLEREGAVLRAKPGVAEELQREKQILNGSLDLGYGFDRSEGFLALRHVGRAVEGWHLPDEFGQAALDILGDLDGAAEGLYRHMRGESVLWFASTFEQAPNPDSRVTLQADTDSLGMRRVRLDWKISDAEKRSVATACRVIGEELARLELARIRIDPWVLEDGTEWQDVEGRYHHIGTTRMSADPRHGVVDRDCRVHGIENLYIAGSSVFATSGYANPTLTIVALAARLADHLSTRLGG